MSSQKVYGDASPVKRLYDVAKQEYSECSREYHPTKFTKFDDAMEGGVRPGDLIVISGESGQGKTSYAQAITLNMLSLEVPTLWFSFEVSRHNFWKKMVSMGEARGIIDRKKPLSIPLFTPAKHIPNDLKTIEQCIIYAKKELGVNVIFIDHLHYIIPLGGDTGNLSYLVGNAVRQIKLMCVKHNVIVFLIAHTKKIYDKEELSLNSIRDSTFVAQEADYVFLVQRAKNKYKEGAPEGNLFSEHTKILLAKNRLTGTNIFQTFIYDNGNYKTYDPKSTDNQSSQRNKWGS